MGFMIHKEVYLPLSLIKYYHKNTAEIVPFLNVQSTNNYKYC